MPPLRPPALPIFRGLTIQLLVFTFLPLTALLLVISFGSLSLHHYAMRSLVGSRDLRLARLAASAAAIQFENQVSLLEGLALQVSAHDGSGSLLHAGRPIESQFDSGLALFSDQGQLLDTTHPEYWQTPAVQSLLADLLSTIPAAPAYSSIHPDPASAEPRLLAAVPLPDGTWAAGSFNPSRLASGVLDDLLIDESLSILLLDQHGRLVYQTGQHPSDMQPVEQGASAAFAGEEGILYSGSGPDERVFAYAPVAGPGWALVIHEVWQATASPLLRTTQLAPLVLVPVLLLALLALAFNARQIIQPLQNLAARAQDLSRGDYQAVEKPVGGIAEIQHLQEELKRMSRRVQAAQESLHSYIGAITTGQEEERRRLARDLHDDTLQALIALNQRIQLARLALEGHEAVRSLDEIQSLTGQTIQNLRRLTRALRPIYLEDLGLAASLEILAQESSRTMDIPVHFKLSGEERRLSPEAELSLYRISQEALSNVARHARASHASLHIHFSEEETRLSIADDGAGYEVPDSTAVFARSGHFGLLGMYERAELAGAHLDIRSAPGEGTLVTVRLKNNDKKISSQPRNL
jgi:signal transduction histidine kinase